MHPVVTPMTASEGLDPAAKALIDRSLRTYTSGMVTPEAMAISSTTFISRCSAGSLVSG